jgi:hypothetical protein
MSGGAVHVKQAVKRRATARKAAASRRRLVEARAAMIGELATAEPGTAEASYSIPEILERLRAHGHGGAA